MLTTYPLCGFLCARILCLPYALGRVDIGDPHLRNVTRFLSPHATDVVATLDAGLDRATFFIGVVCIR